MRRLTATLAAVCAVLPLPAAAGAGIHDELEAVRKGHQASRDVQYEIDRLSGALTGPATTLEERRLAARVRAAEQAVAAELAGLDALHAEVQAMQEAQAGLIPLLTAMLDALDRAIDADLPVDLAERRSAVARARASLSRHDLTLADRYARVLGTWLEEIRFGYTSETGSRRLEIDGRQRVVDIVRIGRLALYYVTPDGTECGLWLPTPARFAPLEARDCHRLAQAVQGGEAGELLAVLPLPGDPP